MKRYFIRKDKINEIRKHLKEVGFENILPKKARAEIVEMENMKLILVEKEPVLLEYNGKYFLTVRGALKLEKIDKNFVVVDKGAIPHIINGADVMRPGVVDYDKNIKKGDFTIIVDENHGKPIAIGISLWDAEDFEKKEKGKCIKNIHYVGDKIWKLSEQLKQ